MVNQINVGEVISNNYRIKWCLYPECCLLALKVSTMFTRLSKLKVHKCLFWINNAQRCSHKLFLVNTLTIFRIQRLIIGNSRWKKELTSQLYYVATESTCPIWTRECSSLEVFLRIWPPWATISWIIYTYYIKIQIVNNSENFNYSVGFDLF